MEDSKKQDSSGQLASVNQRQKVLDHKVDVIDAGSKNGTGRRNLQSEPKAKAKTKTKQSKHKAKAKTKAATGKTAEKKLLKEIPLAPKQAAQSADFVKVARPAALQLGVFCYNTSCLFHSEFYVSLPVVITTSSMLLQGQI